MSVGYLKNGFLDEVGTAMGRPVGIFVGILVGMSSVARFRGRDSRRSDGNAKCNGWESATERRVL